MNGSQNSYFILFIWKLNSTGSISSKKFGNILTVNDLERATRHTVSQRQVVI
ncbi:hypothetical protein NC652_005592 [Populus alba x Populus x berolinensis]|nr:hypothetical protein NC652_005592 [Populus alba x Populus x berolinensis]